MPNTLIEKYTCDRCGFDFKKSVLRRQRGMYLCTTCFDVLDKISTRRPRFSPSRDNSTSTAIPTDSLPEVFSVSAVSGINQIFQSNQHVTDRDGVHKSTFMMIVGNGGPINITAVPQIIAGQVGDILTLRGTSDTDWVRFNDTDALHLLEGDSVLLKYGDTITFVYNNFSITPIGGWSLSGWGETGYGFGGAATEGWVEVSRYKGGL